MRRNFPDEDVAVVQSLSHVQLFCDPMDYNYQAPLSMGFLRQECSCRLPFIFSRGSSQPRNRTCISCITGRFFTTEPPGKPIIEGLYFFTYLLNKYQELLGTATIHFLKPWFSYLSNQELEKKNGVFFFFKWVFLLITFSD